MANYLSIFECRDMDQAEVETSTSYSVKEHFNNLWLFPVTNLSSSLTETNMSGFPEKYKILTRTWSIYIVYRRDRVYHTPFVSESRDVWWLVYSMSLSNVAT